jgi:recombination protein RecA
VVRKSGAWFYYGEERVGQGRENAKDFLKAHPETQEEIYRRILGIADKTADDFNIGVTTTDDGTLDELGDDE